MKKTITKFLYLFLFILLSNSLFSQIDKSRFFYISEVGVHSPDSRTFGYGTGSSSPLGDSFDKLFYFIPSLYGSLSVGYDLVKKEKYTFSFGLSASYEWHNQNKRFNHCIGLPACNYIGVKALGYSYFDLGPFVRFDHKIITTDEYKLSLGANVFTKFNVLRYYDVGWSPSLFLGSGLRGIDVSPFLQLDIDDLSFGLSVRLLHFFKFDNRVYPMHHRDEGFEIVGWNHHNTTKAGLYIKRAF